MDIAAEGNKLPIVRKWNNLNTAERTFVTAHPLAAADFNANATAALAEAQKRFSATSLHNGSGDAFRHCFWSAMNARDQGVDLAKQFGEAHESSDGNPENEKKMDLYNNSIGFEIGKNSAGATNRHLAVLAVEAWAAKRLIQIDENGSGDLVYSNDTEKFLYGTSEKK